MKKTLLLFALLIQAGCASTNNYPTEGNISAKDYQPISGVYTRKNAATETAMLVGSATVSAAAGGAAVPGTPTMRSYTVLVPDTSYKLPEGCEVLDGSK